MMLSAYICIYVGIAQPRMLGARAVECGGVDPCADGPCLGSLGKVQFEEKYLTV